MSYDEAKVKYSQQIGLINFACEVFLGVIYHKENHTPLRIYLLNNTNQPISVAIDSGFFCEDLHSEGEGIVKTFEVSAKGIYEIDRYSEWGELDFTTYWYFYITDVNKNLYKTSCSFSGRVFLREDEIKKRELEVFEFKDGKATEKISETEAGFRLRWDFMEKIKGDGKLLVPPFFYYEDEKSSEERRIKSFLENPNKDLEYLQKYGFATEAEVKEALEKIPEAIEKKKVEMSYKMARLKKLETIQEKLKKALIGALKEEKKNQ